MNFAKSYLKKIRLFFPTLYYSLGVDKLPRRFCHSSVPYFSQWESRELNKHILEGKFKAEDDPHWWSSGATTKTEYAAWSWSGCGMACLKMILAHRQDTILPLVTLGKRCLAYGGYDLPLETSAGLKYAPFVAFITKEFNLKANAVSSLSLPQIITELAKGRYVMASVHPSIRNPKSPEPRQKGGHLVLVLGYDLEKHVLVLHNPSGDSAESQEYAHISFRDFKKFFHYQGIVI